MAGEVGKIDERGKVELGTARSAQELRHGQMEPKRERESSGRAGFPYSLFSPFVIRASTIARSRTAPRLRNFRNERVMNCSYCIRLTAFFVCTFLCLPRRQLRGEFRVVLALKFRTCELMEIFT